MSEQKCSRRRCRSAEIWYRSQQVKSVVMSTDNSAHGFPKGLVNQTNHRPRYCVISSKPSRCLISCRERISTKQLAGTDNLLVLAHLTCRTTPRYKQFTVFINITFYLTRIVSRSQPPFGFGSGPKTKTMVVVISAVNKRLSFPPHYAVQDCRIFYHNQLRQQHAISHLSIGNCALYDNLVRATYVGSHEAAQVSAPQQVSAELVAYLDILSLFKTSLLSEPG